MAQHVAHVLVPHYRQRPWGRLRLVAVSKMIIAPERQYLQWVNFNAIALCYRARGVDALRNRGAELYVTSQPFHETLDVRQGAPLLRRAPVKDLSPIFAFIKVSP